MKSNSILYLAICTLVSLFLTLFLVFCVETFLRFKYQSVYKFGYTLNADDGMFGNNTAVFRRTPPPGPKNPRPWVFCFGGSTTHGSLMPFQYSYPFLMQGVSHEHDRQIWVYNFGVVGVASATTNSFIKWLIPRYRPECVIIHNGYNDLPVLLRKLGPDRYAYIQPDYKRPWNPIPSNPVLRYLVGVSRYNLRAIIARLGVFLQDHVTEGEDLFLGFDYYHYKKSVKAGSLKDVLGENDKRTQVLIDSQIDTINFCLKQGVKVIVVLEPRIIPMYHAKGFKSGFRDENVGEALAECHNIQQERYGKELVSRFGENPNVRILDMRDAFTEKYQELFYDECHANPSGNLVKAIYLYGAFDSLFPEKTKLNFDTP